MIRTANRILLLFFLVLASGCTLISKESGLFGLEKNGEAAMLRLNQLARALSSGEGSQLLGTVPNGVCPPGVDQLLCDSVSSMSAAERDYLVTLIQSSLSSLVVMTESRTARLEISMDRDFMRNDRGQAVAGKTPYGPQGSIYLYGPEIAQYSIARLMALLGHELSHKVDTNLPGWLEDFHQGGYGPFASGQSLADRFGAVLTVTAASLFPLNPACPEILVSQSDARVFYAAHAPEHPVGGPTACGRGWLGDADDSAGYLISGHAIKSPAGFKRAEFYLKIDNNSMDDAVVADLFVLDKGAPISHRSIRRSEFEKAHAFQPFVVLADVPLNASLSFVVDWKRNAELEVLGIQLAGERGARSFLGDWDYPFPIMSPANPPPAIGAVLINPVQLSPSLPGWIKTKLNLADLKTGSYDVYFILKGALSVPADATAVAELEIWEHVILPGMGGSYDGPEVASRTLTASEFHGGSASSPHVFKVSFTADAGKTYDMRVRVLGGLSRIAHYSTVIVPRMPLAPPLQGKFKIGSRYYRGDLASGHFCRYLSFDEMRIEDPFLANDQQLPVLTQTPALAGAGLCELKGTPDSAFRVSQPIPVGYSNSTVVRQRYFKMDTQARKLRSCLSNLDLEGSPVINLPPRDTTDPQMVPVLTHYPDRLAGYTEDETFSCTGAALPDLADVATECTSLSDMQGGVGGSGKLCTKSAGIRFKFTYTGGSPPVPDPDYPHCVNLVYYASTRGSYLCSNQHLSWEVNLEVLSPYYSLWEWDAQVTVLDMDLPPNQWCVELVDPMLALRTDIMDRARGYLCSPQNHQLSGTVDNGTSWHPAFFTH